MAFPARKLRRASEPNSLMTADELLMFPGDGFHKYELEDGHLVVMEPPKYDHGVVCVELVSRLHAYVKAHQLGKVVTDIGYILTTAPDTVRGPDVSYISTERIPPKEFRDKYISGAPDLAVEVVSPNDRPRDLERKIGEYFRAGARLVWIVHPGRRIVTVRYPSGASRVLHPLDVVDGEDVIPGFRCTVGQLFAP